MEASSNGADGLHRSRRQNIKTWRSNAAPPCSRPHWPCSSLSDAPPRNLPLRKPWHRPGRRKSRRSSQAVKRPIQLHHQRPTLPPSRRRARPPHNTKTLAKDTDNPPRSARPLGGHRRPVGDLHERVAELLEPIVKAQGRTPGSVSTASSMSTRRKRSQCVRLGEYDLSP